VTQDGLAQNPHALAGRLRRAETFLRVLATDIAFGREGRAGSRIIRIGRTLEKSRQHRQQRRLPGQDNLRRHRTVRLRREVSPDRVAIRDGWVSVSRSPMI
jgi:hypothetical protein